MLEDSGLILARGGEQLQARDTNASDPIAAKLGLGPWDSGSGPHRATRASTDMDVQAAWLTWRAPRAHQEAWVPQLSLWQHQPQGGISRACPLLALLGGRLFAPTAVLPAPTTSSLAD